MLRDIRRRAANARKLLLSRNAPRGSVRHSGGNRLTLESLEPRMMLDAAGVGDLAITEINYHPFALTESEIGVLNPDPNDPDAVKQLVRDFEFIELKNVSGGPIELGGVHFETREEVNSDNETVVKGFDYTFPSMVLGAGEMVVVANDPTVFRTSGTRYETDASGNLITPDGSIVTLLGPFENATHLSDGGDRILLKSAADDMIVGGSNNGFNYKDSGSNQWPGRADGSGSSLQVIDLAGNPDNPDNWRNSSELFGTPGFEDEAPITDIVINEVLAHTDWPTFDAIELLNLSANTTYDIDGWYLTDSNNRFEKLRQFEIPSETELLGPGDFIVFDENQFNPEWDNIDPNADLPQHFGISGAPSKTNSSGDILDDNEDLWLMKAEGDRMWFVDHVDFGASWNGESFGRTVSTANNVETVFFYPTRDVTLGSENSEPRVGPLVISEIMYDLDDKDPDDDYLDYIEIFNPTNNTTSLKHWQIRGGVQFDFPLDDANKVRVESQSAVVVVKFDPSTDSPEKTAFLAQYGLLESEITLAGPYDGKLSNSGEKIRLLNNDEPPLNGPQDFYPHVVEDEVAYDKSAPWPTQAGGEGKSINRIAYDAWGHQSSSWIAADPSPGTAYTIMPPYAMDDTVTMASGTSVEIVVRANDIAFANSLDPATVVIPSEHQPEHGTWQINAGTVKYTPAPGFWGIDTFRYTIKDIDGGESNEAVVTVIVNDPPVAADFTVDISPGDLGPWTVDVLAHVSDPNGDPLWLSVLEGTALFGGAEVDPAATVQNPTDNRIVFDPNPGFSGVPQFEYEIEDSFGGTDTGKVTLNILVPNEPPTANSQAVATDEDTELAVTLTGDDDDGDSLTYVIVSNPNHGTLSGTGPNWTYLPAEDYHGPDEFTFKVNDGTVDSATATVSISVNSINDPPTANSQAVATDEDTDLAVTLTGNDDDGDPLTYVIVSNPNHGTLSGTGPNWTYLPAEDYHGPDEFTFKVNDGTVDSATATVSISVNSINDPPTVDSQAVATDEDTDLAVTLTGNDDDGDPLTYVIVSNPNHGALSGTGPNWTYLPAEDYHGPDEFTFKVNDGTVDSATATVSITVNSVNDQPTAEDDTATMNEDASTTIDVLANDTDPDGTVDPDSVEIIQQPASGGQAEVDSEGTITYTPPLDFSGEETFTYRVSDNDGTDSNEATVTITVNPVNDPPLALNDSAVTDEDESVTIVVLNNDTDPDSPINPISVFVIQQPSNGTAHSNMDGSIIYTPPAGFHGEATFTYRVKDFEGAESNEATVTVTVNEVSEDLLAEDDPDYAVAEDGTLTVQAPGVLGNDVADGLTALADLVGNVENGTLLLQPDGSFDYTPNPDFHGTDSFTYRAVAGAEASNTATVTITVDPVNDAPVAIDHQYNMDENGTLVEPAPGLLAGAIDVDGDIGLTAEKVDGPSHGSLALNPNGSFVYEPDADFDGIDSFTYRVSDGQIDSATATVSITVEKVSTIVIESLGTVDFRQIANLDPADGDHWYRFTAIRAGTLTAQLVATQPGPNTRIVLYADLGNDQRQMLAEGDARVDYDATFGGQTYLLQVTGLEATADLVLANLVQFLPGSGHVLVFGSAGDDTFEVALGGSSPGVSVNGIDYPTDATTGMTILGGGGSDQITVTGTSSNEVAMLSPSMGSLAGLVYQVQWSGTTRAIVYSGGGDDVAFLYDSPGDDEFTATPTYAAMVGDGFENTARFFNSVHAQAIGGGNDVAKLFDSEFNDLFVSTPTYGALSSTRFYNRAWYFDAVHAYAENGGIDVAKMFDSAGDDTFHATPTEASLSRAGEFYNRAKNFEGVHAYATNGGVDTAKLFGSAGDDTFYTTPVFGALFGDGFYNRAKHFEEVYAEAGAGGNDQALLHDSEMADLLEADGNWARLSNAELDFLYEAIGFGYVKATASSSADKKIVPDESLLDFNLDSDGPWT